MIKFIVVIMLLVVVYILLFYIIPIIVFNVNFKRLNKESTITKDLMNKIIEENKKGSK